MYKKIIFFILLFTCLVKNNVAAQYWSALGQGIAPSYSSVRSLTSYNGGLYAGGYFGMAGNTPANNVAKWNGINWSPVGSGTNGTVASSCVFNGELYAGGYFDTAGNVPANRIAKWNGTNWSDVGGIEAYYVYSIEVFNGELYAGGWFQNLSPTGTNMAKWNGTSWSDAGIGLDTIITEVYCMTVYNGELCVAGGLDYYGGGVPSDFCIAKWNGTSWMTLVTIPAIITLDGAIGGIYSMTVYNGSLYVAGSFTTIDGIPANQIAKWNGTSWSAVGTGINPAFYPIVPGDGGLYSFVGSLAVYNNALYAGGFFDSAGVVITKCIAKWDGNNWSALGGGINGEVFGRGIVLSMAGSDSALFVGGWFDSVDGGNIPASNIAAWSEFCIAAPPTPGPISGNNSVCQNSSQTYSVNPVTGATSYTWILPAGWTGSSTTHIITATVGANSGTISVTANNNCGSSSAQTLTVTVNPTPLTPGPISGNNSICQNSFQTYSVSPVPGATSYTWILPSGWTGSSNTQTITAIAGANSGTISVTANNTSCSSPAQTLAVTVNTVPPQPGSISGNNSVCQNNSQTYSINSVPGATSYTWILPSGWTGSSNTNIINATAGVNSGTISVTANNSCGSSNAQTLAVTVNLPPSVPGPISGNNSVCQGNTQTYSVSPVPGAASYTWILPLGWTGISNTNTIIATAGANSGIISVIANNNCGSSIAQTLTATVNFSPSLPGPISGNNSVCQGNTQTYSISPVNGASGYTWTLPPGWAGSSISNSITTTVGTSGGTISVIANNSCGSSSSQTLAVTVNSVPVQPGAINGNDPVCKGSIQTYFVSPVNGASGYTWILPPGWIGSSNTNSITATAGSNGGTLLVSANNSCGNSSYEIILISVDSIPARPDEIIGDIFVNTGQSYTYSINTVNGATGYTWSVSGGGIIIAGQSSSSTIVNWQTAGIYTLSVNALNTCGSSMDQRRTITVVGSGDDDPYEIKLMPNPSSGEFYLKAKRVQDKLINIEVLNISGQVVYRTGKLQGSNNYSQLIDLKKMAGGLYVVKVFVDHKVYVRKIIKTE